jgi:uncharacterized PurR-regulated membrane protein YhhQ (DUF165 family)
MQNVTNTKEGTTMKAMLVALIVFAVTLVLTVVSFFVLWVHPGTFDLDEEAWETLFLLTFIIAMVAVGALLVVVFLGFRAFLRPLEDNDSNGGGSNL